MGICTLCLKPVNSVLIHDLSLRNAIVKGFVNLHVDMNDYNAIFKFNLNKPSNNVTNSL